MPRTAVFDLDGTLVDSAPDLAAALNRMLATRGLAPHALPEVVGMIGDGARALVARGFSARGITLDAPALAATTAAFLADYEANLLVETRLYPGAAETLGMLAGAGWRLAVCTNKPQIATQRILAGLGIAGQFAAVGTGDSFPVRKPDPAHLAATLAEMGASTDHAVMIGDHHNDILAARGCGVPSVWAAWGYGSSNPGADEMAHGFDALPRLLERMRPGQGETGSGGRT